MNAPVVGIITVGVEAAATTMVGGIISVVIWVARLLKTNRAARHEARRPSIETALLHDSMKQVRSRAAGWVLSVFSPQCSKQNFGVS
jgi:hypothetical protein